MITQHIVKIMSKKEEKREESRNSRVIWKTYKSRIKKHPNNNYIYCFFEGDDDPKYYNSKIENITKKEVSHFICNKKKEVLKTLKAFKLKEAEELLAFFIDKDFDDFLGVSYNYDNLYTTPCYAIENFYTDINVFKKVLKIELKINEENELYDKYIKAYKDRQQEFHEIFLEINTLATMHQFLKHKNMYKEDIKYETLDKSKSNKKIIKVSLFEVRLLKEVKLFDHLKDFIDSNEEAKQKYIEFKAELRENSKCKFRGKFEIVFLNKFINSLIDEININSNSKAKFNINEANIISNLSQYAQTDENLEVFLNKLISDNS